MVSIAAAITLSPAGVLRVLAGNQADAHALLPVVTRVRRCFGLSRVCLVADRGMISADTIREFG